MHTSIIKAIKQWVGMKKNIDFLNKFTNNKVQIKLNSNRRIIIKISNTSIQN